jgi:uncharacterized protein
VTKRLAQAMLVCIVLLDVLPLYALDGEFDRKLGRFEFELDLRAAKQGSPVAQIQLGLDYEEGRIVPKDLVLAAAWMRKSAEQGLAIGQLNLAIMYGRGTGVDQDDAEAAKWLLKAARQGNADAQYYLADAIQHGRGIPKVYKDYFRWYWLSAAQGHALALCNFGAMFINGDGVAKNTLIGYALSRRSAEIDPTAANPAATNLGIVLGMLSPDQLVAANVLAEKLSRNGNFSAELLKALKSEARK